MSTLVPPLFEGLVDDASAATLGGTPVAEAVALHRVHRAAWYAPFVGPLLVPVSAVAELNVVDPPEVALLGDTGIDALSGALQRAGSAGAAVRHVEVAVAKRGEDPQPGLAKLRALVDAADVDVYAEIPLTWGLLAALDTVAGQRADGIRIAAKFRTGGLAAELFPTPVELAAVICACRDRDLPFKLTAGLHHALRHTDPETGFAHHGFLNVLVACAVAAEGAEVAEVAELLGATHPVPLVEPIRVRRSSPRPLWRGFGAVAVRPPLTDLLRFGLINGGPV